MYESGAERTTLNTIRRRSQEKRQLKTTCRVLVVFSLLLLYFQGLTVWSLTRKLAVTLPCSMRALLAAVRLAADP